MCLWATANTVPHILDWEIAHFIISKPSSRKSKVVEIPRRIWIFPRINAVGILCFTRKAKKSKVIHSSMNKSIKSPHIPLNRNLVINANWIWTIVKLRKTVLLSCTLKAFSSRLTNTLILGRGWAKFRKYWVVFLFVGIIHLETNNQQLFCISLAARTILWTLPCTCIQVWRKIKEAMN